MSSNEYSSQPGSSGKFSRVPDAADRWLAENDRRGRLPTVPRGPRQIKTRWTMGATMISIHLPRRNYRRREQTIMVSPYEAEALIRNLGRRLADRGGET